LPPSRPPCVARSTPASRPTAEHLAHVRAIRKADDRGAHQGPGSSSSTKLKPTPSKRSLNCT
jgi:hypothetical protein